MSFKNIGRIGCLLILVATGFVQAQTFKIATLSPDGSYWMNVMRESAAAIAEATDNRVKFRFYPGGVMGSDDAVMRKIRIGQLQGAAIPGGILARQFRDADIYSLPLKFKSFDEVDFVRQSMDDGIEQGFDEAGFVTFGLAEGGFAYIMSTSPIRTIEEVQKRKVWIPANDEASLRAVQAYGITPIPLALADVLAGLQTGLIDTVASSPIGAIALQWHTQVSHMTDLPMMYFYAVLAVDKKRFGKLSEEDQVVVRKHMTAAFNAIDSQNRKDNVDAYQALLKQGIEAVSLTDAEKAGWYQQAEIAQQAMVDEGVVSEAAAQQLNTLLQELQAGQ